MTKINSFLLTKF